MRTFEDAAGRSWVAGAQEEDTPRHHGRWYFTLQPADGADAVMPMPEVRWQTRATAERTILAMSLFELRRRLSQALRRAGAVA